MNENINDKWKCGCSKETYQKKLDKAEDWEVKKKEKLKEILDNDKAPSCFYNEQTGSHSLYSTGGRGDTYLACPNGCGKMYKKVTEYGDEKELEHECKQSNHYNREREREREQIKQYLLQNNIHSITLQANGELLIEYNNQETQTMNANNQALKQIKSYLQSQGKQSISQQELKTEQVPKKNYLPWILGGVGITAIIAGLVYFLTKKRG